MVLGEQLLQLILDHVHGPPVDEQVRVIKLGHDESIWCAIIVQLEEELLDRNVTGNQHAMGGLHHGKRRVRGGAGERWLVRDCVK